MVAKEVMEQHESTFLTKEQREDIRFYQDWLETVLVTNGGRPHDLSKARDTITAQLEGYEEVMPKDVVELLKAAINSIQSEATRLTQEVVDELNTNVFYSGIFRVGIVSSIGLQEVEAVIVYENELVVPIVKGQVYLGRINEVLFDK